MNFYELTRGQAFRFVERDQNNEVTYYSCGTDGAYGRYVESPDDMGDHKRWYYCRPLDAVEVVE